MASSSSGSPRKHEPYFYTIFQAFCSGPRANAKPGANRNGRQRPIAEQVKTEADSLVRWINRFLIEDLKKLTVLTSVIPSAFFPEHDPLFLQHYLIDRPIYAMMVRGEIINWITSFRQLFPIRTSGNGNCLLHAVLIAMVGIHDFNLHLRDRLIQFMVDYDSELKTSWRIEQKKINRKYGIQSQESQLNQEWNELRDIVRYETTEDGQVPTRVKYLESMHIFSISNMLRRPIIVLSDDVIRNARGDPISVNDLYGIYLPTLSKPEHCHRKPIVLAYDQYHFCPLQGIDAECDKTASTSLLPLYPSREHVFRQTLLPMRFLGHDDSATESRRLLDAYLDVREKTFHGNPGRSSLPLLCAELSTSSLPPVDNFFLIYYHYCNDHFQGQKSRATADNRQRESDVHVPPIVNGDAPKRSDPPTEPVRETERPVSELTSATSNAGNKPEMDPPKPDKVFKPVLPSPFSVSGPHYVEPNPFYDDGDEFFLRQWTIDDMRREDMYAGFRDAPILISECYKPVATRYGGVRRQTTIYPSVPNASVNGSHARTNGYVKN